MGEIYGVACGIQMDKKFGLETKHPGRNVTNKPEDQKITTRPKNIDPL